MCPDTLVALPSQNPPMLSGLVVVAIDAVTEDGITGWASAISHESGPVVIEVWIDGTYEVTLPADIDRPDVRAAGFPSARVGFCATLPRHYIDNNDHTLEIRLPSTDKRGIRSAAGDTGCANVFRLSRTEIAGHVDGLRDGVIRGWVIARDRITGVKAGGQSVIIMINSQPVAQVRAIEIRPDVAKAHGCEPHCGFSFTPPHGLFAGRDVEVICKVLPLGEHIPGSPSRIAFPSTEMLAQFRQLNDTTDRLFAELWQLRKKMKAFVIEEPDTSVMNYHQWALRYHQALKDAPDQLDALTKIQSPLPLVSIITPVYRPNIADFRAAVVSVLAQSYPHWELILVDDASGQEPLSVEIAALSRMDPRIRSITMKKNGGISRATNAAFRKAKGDWIMLFDHDDLFHYRAIEFLVTAALRDDALMVYADEDKIDENGVYSEPNLKPDWNYRLLLSINYVCHCTLIRKDVLSEIGGMKAQYDGAQDHDFFLRIAETIPANRILHVPEILYHWRKTPFSTALSGEAKPYTVKAGIHAITDHLRRQKLHGKVMSPRNITTYEIEWVVTKEPSVTILIPYREQITMTRDCVAALLENTDYTNFNIVLIDNGSSTPEALAFARDITAHQSISVTTICEPFNYSRLNNLAASESKSDLLLFLNNDVIVRDPKWLKQMVGEMFVRPDIAIVGCKLLYPNDTVQHAGVILGAGGVADHAHKGLASDHPGFCARAICAQEMSAVTAAAMLCRRDVFEKVGGFDEVHLKVAFNDIDFCLKARKAGYKVMWTPMVVAEHRESLSRGDDMNPEHQVRFFDENETMMERWGHILAADPFYHRLFSLRTMPFTALNAPNPQNQKRRVTFYDDSDHAI